MTRARNVRYPLSVERALINRTDENDTSTISTLRHPLGLSNCRALHVRLRSRSCRHSHTRQPDTRSSALGQGGATRELFAEISRILEEIRLERARAHEDA